LSAEVDISDKVQERRIVAKIETAYFVIFLFIVKLILIKAGANVLFCFRYCKVRKNIFDKLVFVISLLPWTKSILEKSKYDITLKGFK